jgi:membrane protein YdbS with pleckstrin-like domain
MTSDLETGQQSLMTKRRTFLGYLGVRICLTLSYCGVLVYLYFSPNPNLIVVGVLVVSVTILIHIWFAAFRKWSETVLPKE